MGIFGKTKGTELKQQVKTRDELDAFIKGEAIPEKKPEEQAPTINLVGELEKRVDALIKEVTDLQEKTIKNSQAIIKLIEMVQK